MIDLHTHSVYSDGYFTPEEVVEKAYNKGVRTLALSDHDTLQQVPDFLEAAKKYPALKPIIACETSSRYELDDEKEVHILALGVKNLDILEQHIKKARFIRNAAVIERIKLLQQNGYDINFDEVILSCKGTFTNEHIKRILYTKKLVPDVSEKLSFFKSGGIARCCVYPQFPNSKETIEAINASGAISVLAHPYKFELNDEDLTKYVKELTSYGLKGIEAYHSNQTLKETVFYLELAKKFNLFVSGGSDHHGKPEQMHKEYGWSNKLAQKIPEDLAEKMGFH
jgi:predicted metal-dependent phosphoesterase TrpH